MQRYKIKNSPGIDTEQLVSRQHEIGMYEYDPRTSYWGGGMGVSGMMTEVHEPLAEAVRRDNSTDTKDANGDPHLRNTHKVTDDTIHATDGILGDVEDFIMDDTSWKLVRAIKWDASEVKINVSEADVKNSPEYEPGEAISESYAATLQNYYGKFVEAIY